MAILEYTQSSAGLEGVNPRIIRMVTDDTVAAVTTAGYLTQSIALGNAVYEADIFYIWTTDDGTQIFYPTFSNNIVTLNLFVSDGNVLLPVVSGHAATFNGTTGQIKDSGLALSTTTGVAITVATGSLTNNHVVALDGTGGSIKDGGVLGTAAAKAASDNTKATLASVDAATTINHIAKFSDTAGTVADGGVLGTAAAKAASDNTKATVASVNSATTIGHLLSAADIAGTVTDSGLVAVNVLITGISTPDTAADLVKFDVTVGQAALAAAGHVDLYVSSSTKQYKIRELFLNGFGTNFSGGGGDRTLSITDGTSVYSIIPAATAQSLANTAWGATGLPFPASVALNTSTVAGASLKIQYAGGTTDYTAGSCVISGILERVA